MMNYMRVTMLQALFIFFLTGNALALPIAKITIRAVDELGNVIEGAQVRSSFSVPNESGIGLASINDKGTTNTEGLFVVSGETIGRTGFSVDKGGYYQSGSGYEFTTRNEVLNRWEPWNPTIEVVLKKKRNPVGMYVKSTQGTKIPKTMFGQTVGYDLEKGDLVAPYGQGIASDFLIKLDGEERAYTDYECSLTITFSNEGDGIQEYFFDPNEQSLFKWPFEAPLEGYQDTLFRRKSNNPGVGYKDNLKDNVKYIFRVRTKKDSKGKIIEAKYGKISREFGFDTRGSINIGYFFNPDGTRNLEEDPEKNLFRKQ